MRKTEIFTSRDAAINKLMQMQGVCQSTLTNGNSIEVFALKKEKSQSQTHQRTKFRKTTLLSFLETL